MLINGDTQQVLVLILALAVIATSVVPDARIPGAV